ncbi:MAG: TonB-dependent receptor plug domain-containing protein [Bacteroidetes bacterium]|nr:TonB-dependent receptor plug domain-containing protein [Bacteroidota bacterium]
MDKKAGNSSFMSFTGNFLVLLILFLFTPLSPTVAFSGVKELGTSGVIQKQKVKGKITDETGNPIPGASIIVKGTTVGTISDADGNFEIEVSSNSTLLISSMGYEDQEIQVSGQTSDISVSLKEKIQFLNEIVVVGYGSQKKETVTGSISTVSSEDIIRQPVTDLSQALVGRMPGLVALNPGGRPGKENNTIFVRGRGTFGDASPLIMIDGIERDQNALISLDPNEIEAISMLKDASATAVFGVRGANGVILVTTKRGQVGPAKVNYTGNFALIQPYEKLNLIDSYTQTGLANEFMGFPANTDDPTAPFPVSLRDRYKGVVQGNPVESSDPFSIPAQIMKNLCWKTTQHNNNTTLLFRVVPTL